MSKREELISLLKQKFEVTEDEISVIVRSGCMRYVLKNSLIDSFDVEELVKRVTRDFEGYRLRETKEDDDEEA